MYHAIWHDLWCNQTEGILYSLKVMLFFQPEYKIPNFSFRHNCGKYLLHIFVASLSCGIISMSILKFGGMSTWKSKHLCTKTFTILSWNQQWPKLHDTKQLLIYVYFFLFHTYINSSHGAYFKMINRFVLSSYLDNCWILVLQLNAHKINISTWMQGHKPLYKSSTLVPLTVFFFIHIA